MQQMYACPNCRAQVAFGQSVCGNCGVNLDWGAQQPPPPSYNQQYTTGQQMRYGKAIALLKRKHPSGIMISAIVLLFVLVVGGIAFALNGNLFVTSPSSPPGEPAPTSTPPPPLQKPPAITSFSFNPATITKGQTATLQWNVTGATSVSIDQGIGTVSSSGTKVLSPTATTTYVLTATNKDGYMTASATVEVSTPNVPVIVSFTANPSTISAGQPANLQWNISGATSVFVDPDIGPVSASWMKDVLPTKTTTYTLTATNREGSVTSSVTVTVGSTPAPVVTSFTATPSSISAGQTSILDWNVTAATSISIHQEVGVVISSGTKEVSPTATTTYTLSARNNVGTVTATAKITVGSTNLPVIDSFYANPLSINSGGSSTLAWTVTGADSVSIDQGIGTVSSTSTTVYPTNTTPYTYTYTLTAVNSYDTVSQSVPITITP